MDQFERQANPKADEAVGTALDRYAGLRETLWALCDPMGEEQRAPRLSFSELVTIFADDEEALDASVRFLSPRGEGGRRDREIGEELQLKFAWALVGEMRKRLKSNRAHVNGAS